MISGAVSSNGATMMTRFRQLFDDASSTYTYLIADPASGHAALIDPVLEQIERDLALLRELGLKLVWVLETHVHADHVTAAARLRQETGAAVCYGIDSGVDCADRLLQEGDEIALGGETLRVLATPGHTDGCISYLWRDRVFTGDALLIGSCGRTDFQEGDSGRLYDSITRRLFSLPGETLVYPTHDYAGRRVSSIDQERATNEFAGRGATREAFIAALADLDLGPPQKLAVAVPANRLCGRAGTA